MTSTGGASGSKPEARGPVQAFDDAYDAVGNTSFKLGTAEATATVFLSGSLLDNDTLAPGSQSALTVVATSQTTKTLLGGEVTLIGAKVGNAFNFFGRGRVFGEVGTTDAPLPVYFGAHQSIGCKGITLFGTDDQKKRWLTACDVRTANSVQLLAALVVTLPLALLEAEPVRWHPEAIGAMAWSVLVLTLGGSSLLYLLIQRGAATSVTSLMYLVPPCTALLAWLLFGEALTLGVLVGLAFTAVGVALVVRTPPQRA